MTEQTSKQENKLRNGRVIENQDARIAAAKDFVEAEGLRIKHFRMTLSTPVGELVNQNGGLTVVYRQREGNSFVELATTICSEKDTFIRKVGIALAAERFKAGQVITVPTYGLTDDQTVELLFRSLVTFEGEDHIVMVG